MLCYTPDVFVWLLLLGFTLSSDTVPDLHQKGVGFYKEHKYSEAISLLEKSFLQEKVGSTEYYESALLIGNSYFMLSQAPKAIPWLEKLPSNNEANYMLGYAYLQAGRQAGSVGAFARLFGVDPESAAAHLLAAQMMIKKEFNTQGVSEAKAALAINPNLPGAHFLIAEIDIFEGRIEEGVRQLREEIRINPNSHLAWYRLGEANARVEDWDSAISNLQRAIWLNENFSSPYVVMGKCYYKKHDYANAERLLRHAREIDPKNSTAAYLLGRTLVETGRTAEGRQILREARNPDR